MVDAAADADYVLQHLRVDTRLVAGWSGGGAHALACAARLPQTTAAAIIAAGAPYPAEGLDWLAGMHEGNVEAFTEAIHGESGYGRSWSAICPRCWPAVPRLCPRHGRGRR